MRLRSLLTLAVCGFACSDPSSTSLGVATSEHPNANGSASAVQGGKSQTWSGEFITQRPVQLDNGDIFIFGQTPNRGVSPPSYPRSIRIYAPASDTLREIDAKSERKAFAVWLESYKTPSGVITVDADATTVALRRFNVETSEWSDLPAPPALGLLSDVVQLDNADLLLFHASGASRVAAATGESRQLNGFSTAVNGGAVKLKDGRVLYVVGYKSEAQLFDPATESWTQIPGATRPRNVPAVVALPDGRALLVAGVNQVDNQTTQQPITEYFDPSSLSWTEGVTLPNSVTAPEVSVTNGTVMLWGGIDFQCGEKYCSSNQVTQIDISQNTTKSLPVSALSGDIYPFALSDSEMVLIGSTGYQRYQLPE